MAMPAKESPVSYIRQKRLPDWLRRSLPEDSTAATNHLLRRYDLHTVCEEARCPNRSECFSHRIATFMILGDICTRRCAFCSVTTGIPGGVDQEEPKRVAEAAGRLSLRYVVVTSVDRDDLADEGAGQFVRTIAELRNRIPEAEIEVLTPDFHARHELIRAVVDAQPTVYNHNLETVARLQQRIRPKASYECSLKTLAAVKQIAPCMITKSGLMLGRGERQDEVVETARDLRKAGCDILTVGQYLQPDPRCMPVVEYVAPEVFAELADTLKSLGFLEVYAGPYIRSSYHAGETFIRASEVQHNLGAQ